MCHIATMPVKATPRYVFTLITVSVVVCFAFVNFFWHQKIGTRDANYDLVQRGNRMRTSLQDGQAIMPKLGNETAKAELGRASWKYFHTVMARFPDKPTKEESSMLTQHIHLFQKLYPCGECAQHFGDIIARFPPQVSSRSAAATWGCHVHNEVNKSLKKELFDCSNIGDFYDCGCAEDEAEEKAGSKESSKPVSMKES